MHSRHNLPTGKAGIKVGKEQEITDELRAERLAFEWCLKPKRPRLYVNQCRREHGVFQNIEYFYPHKPRIGIIIDHDRYDKNLTYCRVRYPLERLEF